MPKALFDYVFMYVFMKSSENLVFSVIIPTYNRADILPYAVNSVLEVIVVDDGSDVPLIEALKPFQDSLNLVSLRQANAGPAAARHRAAQKAQGCV